MALADPIFSRLVGERSPQQATKARQDLIKKIENLTGRRLIVYVASLTHPISGIMAQDIPLFEDLLRVPKDIQKCDLMINSPGGDPDTADKIILMCRQRFPLEFNVIVPNYAKSAATLIALGADKIFMGYLSELGPVDPQIPYVIPGVGQTQLIPAKAYLGGLDEIRKRIVETKDPFQMYWPILSQIRPEMIKFCEDAITASLELAKKWLTSGMLKHDPGQAEAVAYELVKGEKYRTHGKTIGYKEAKEELKLNVEMIDNTSELWQLIWELYLRSIQTLQESIDAAKLFESASSSMTLNIRIIPQRRPPQPAAAPPAPPRPPPPSTQP